MSKTISEKLVEIAGNEQKVYEAGHDAGYTEGLNKGGYADGFEEGKKAEYDAFWDVFQNYGKRTAYYSVFSGGGWNAATFKPKYDIKMEYSARQAFIYNGVEDVAQSLEDCGVTMDISKSTDTTQLFYGAQCKRLPLIDFSNSGSCGNAFYDCKKLETIDMFIPSEKASATYSGEFTNCSKLKNIKFGGDLLNTMSFSDCKELSADSIRSIIEHLSDTASGKTLTLSRTAVDTAIANGEFGGDTVYFSTDGALSAYLYSNPITLSKGQTIKVIFDVDDDHSLNIDNEYTDWWFGLAGVEVTAPYKPSGWTYTATQDNEHVTIHWYFHSDLALSNIPIKIRVALVDGDGDETGENLHSFVTDIVTDNGTTLTIAEESWETLKASKSNWTISDN